MRLAWLLPLLLSCATQHYAVVEEDDEEPGLLPAVIKAAPERHGCTVEVANLANDVHHCPEWGCVEKDSPDGLVNELKRAAALVTDDGEVAHPAFVTRVAHSPTDVTIHDLAELHVAALEALSGHQAHLKPGDRKKLRHLHVSGGTFSEGDHVRLTGYITPVQRKNEPPVGLRVNSGESVNCYTTGHANNDFHLNLTPQPGGDECQGAVVEMTPQLRRASWTPKKITSLVGKQIMVTGLLFFDNKHALNPDCARKYVGKSTDPRRISVWEVHPVHRFFVCKKGHGCAPASANDWAELD